jgi:hypothetical protein
MAINASVHTVIAPATRAFGRTSTASRRTNIRLWVTQGTLAAIFLFAGASKLVISDAALEQDSDFPALFLRFIGLCEVLGGVGVVLPWALRIKPGLTPLAAAGLAIIMVGAAVTVAFTMAPPLALINVAIGLAALSVVTGRRDFARRTR